MILNIGHRGVGHQFIENSLLSFERAIQSRLDMIEMDIQLSNDHEVIVFHDENLVRLTSLNVQVAEMTLKALKQLHLYDQRSVSTSYGQIPTLKEVFSLTKNKIALNIEFKNCYDKNHLLVKKTVELINEFNMGSQVVLSSFNREILELIHYEDNSLRCGYILDEKDDIREIFPISFNLYSIHPHKNIVKRKLVRFAHERSIKLFPWTVNSTQEMKKLISDGVDGIITDYPHKLSNTKINSEISQMNQKINLI